MKKISYFIITILLIQSIFLLGFTDNVNAINYNLFYGFENTLASNQVTFDESGQFFESWDSHSGSGSEVDTTYAYAGGKSYRVHDAGAGANNVYFNCSPLVTDYFINMTFWIYYESGDTQNGLNCFDIYMYDDLYAVGNILWHIFFESDTSTLHLDFGYFDHNGAEQIIRLTVDDDLWHKIWINYNTADNITIGIYDSGDSASSEVTGIQPVTVVANPKFGQLRFHVEAQYDSEEFFVDNIKMLIGTEAYGEEEDTFYLRLWNIEDGQRLAIYGLGNNNLGQFVCVEGVRHIKGSVVVDDADPELHVYSQYYGSSEDIPITAVFNQGESYSVHIVGADEGYIPACIDGTWTNFESKDKDITLYAGQTYDFWLYPLDYTGQQDYSICNTGWCWKCDNVEPKFCLAKTDYAYDEPITIKYKFPHPKYLLECGKPTTGYIISLYDPDNKPFPFYPSPDNDLYTWKQSQSDFYVDGEWHYLQFNTSTYYGIKKSYARYFLHFYHTDLFDMMDCPSPAFAVTGETFTPEGSIISISPANPKMNQEIEISFTANTTGDLYIEHDISGDWVKLPYVYSSGTHLSYYTPMLPDTYTVILYSDYQDTVLDTDSFTCSGDFDLSGYAGYNVEYLEMFEYRFIAGDPNRNVTIKYRALKNGTLVIQTPRGENSSYSTAVNTSGRMHSFHLPSNAPIGEWNVTLFANSTHYTSFNVVSEENNYVEFGKNVYYDNEQFNLLIKHTYYVGILFKWNGVAQGETWRLADTQYTYERNLPVPKTIANPKGKIGTWTVELWRLNFENKQYILASHVCTVEIYVAPLDTEGGFQFPNLGVVMGSFVGMIVTLFTMFLPLILLKGLHLKQVLPPVTYVLSGSIGLSVSILAGFFPFWVAPFVLIGGVIVLVFKYFLDKRGEGE